MPGFADSLEAEVRREGAHSAAEARARWERDRWPLEELDRLARARDTDAFAAELESRLATLFAAPYRRTATVLSGPQLEEARAFAKAQEALAELRAVLGSTARRSRARAARDGAARGARGRDAAAGPRAGGGSRGDPRAPLRGGLLLRAPGGRVPARRLARAVPVRRRPARARHRERARAARARGPARPRALPVLRLRLPRRAPARAQLPLERRGGQPADRVVLRGRRARAARQTAPSCRTRSLSEVTWRPEDAPTAAEWDRAHAATGPRRPRAAAPSRSAPSRCSTSCPRRDAVAARALENFADCPVKWLVEDLLKPEELVPDPEAMVRGSYAHEVLTPHLRAAGRGDRQPPRDPRQPRRRRAHPDRGAARPELLLPALAEADARARRGAPARVRPAALPPLRGRLRLPGSSRSSSSATSAWASPSRSSSRAACACAAGSTAWTSATAWRS